MRRAPLSAAALSALLASLPARADETRPAEGAPSGRPQDVEPLAPTTAETDLALAAPIYRGSPFDTKPGYLQMFATAYVGTGLRFNNPYRLATPLGDDAESLSRTATYGDVGFAMTFGNPLGVQHGAALRTSFAVEGVGQVVMTPSYLAYRRWRALAVQGRLGVPAVLTPEVTWGMEAALGGTWFFLGGIGASAEIVGDVFYGAGTAEVAAATYPVLSGQLGLVFAYEVLP